MQQFDMDDFMQTYPSEEEARRIAKEIKTVLQTGGFNLTKFLSKKPTALENLLEEEKDKIKTQRILGQTWDPKTDSLIFAKTQTSLYRTTADSKKGAFNGSFSVLSSWLISPLAIRFRCLL